MIKHQVCKSRARCTSSTPCLNVCTVYRLYTVYMHWLWPFPLYLLQRSSTRKCATMTEGSKKYRLSEFRTTHLQQTIDACCDHVNCLILPPCWLRPAALPLVSIVVAGWIRHHAHHVDGKLTGGGVQVVAEGGSCPLLKLVHKRHVGRAQGGVVCNIWLQRVLAAACSGRQVARGARL